MCPRLLLAAALAPLPAASDSLRGRIVSDDGMPLPSSTKVELACGQSRLERAAVREDGLFEVDHRGGRGDCVLVIDAPGYRRTEVQPSTLPKTPGIPGVVLHRLGKSQGETISVSHLAAPPEAKRRFQAAIREMRRGQEAAMDVVLENLEAAARIYPGYAEAWFEIGRLRLAQQDPEGAVAAFRQAVRADPWFVSPYEPLILLLRAGEAAVEAAGVCESLRRVNPALPADCGNGQAE